MSGSETPVREPEGWPDFAPFDCPICFDHVGEPESGMRLHQCGHATCRACAVDVVSTAVNSAKVLDLCCPSPSCETMFSYNQIRRDRTYLCRQKLLRINRKIYFTVPTLISHLADTCRRIVRCDSLTLNTPSSFTLP